MTKKWTPLDFSLLPATIISVVWCTPHLSWASWKSYPQTWPTSSPSSPHPFPIRPPLSLLHWNCPPPWPLITFLLLNSSEISSFIIILFDFSAALIFLLLSFSYLLFLSFSFPYNIFSKFASNLLTTASPSPFQAPFPLTNFQIPSFLGLASDSSLLLLHCLSNPTDFHGCSTLHAKDACFYILCLDVPLSSGPMGPNIYVKSQQFFFDNRLNSEYFRVCGLNGVIPTTYYSAKSTIDNDNKRTWLCSNRTLFMDTKIRVLCNSHKLANILLLLTFGLLQVRILYNFHMSRYVFILLIFSNKLKV